jgi:mono/diheme cytochrome c family protein
MGAISPEQRKEAESIRADVDKAGRLYVDGKFEEAGEVIKSVQMRVDKFCETADAQAIKLLDPITTRLTKAHALLELEGVILPALNKPMPGLEKPAPMPNTPAPAGAGTSFVTQIAPLLVARCGGCHVRDAKGMFSMANYATLMKGPAEGVVIFPGEPVGSRIIEVIESGDMPRGGGKIAPAELALLAKWIAEGAKFDGKDPTANLAALTPDAKVDAPAMVAVVEATGKETVSFAKDVAPHLSGTCFNCHGAGQQTRAGFNLTTFSGLLKGGDSGAPITPGKGAESLLIKKLKGTAEGNRMPQNLPPLPDNVIAKIEKWIDEGAKYDGGDPAMNLKQVALLAKATGSTHEELAAERMKLAEERWLLGMPGIAKSTVETKNFLIVGNLGENSLKQVGEQAEAIAPKIATMLKAPSDTALIKGRMTLFVFDQRYDYAEFGNMVERRELPKEVKGHFSANPVEVYGAMLHSKTGEYSTEALIAQQLAGAYVANLGKSGPPRWFSEGVARAMAAKISDSDARVNAWDTEMARIISSMQKPDDFLTGKLSPEDSDICSYSFVKFLMNDGRKFDLLLAALRQGDDFTQAFSTTYKGSPAQMTVAWAPKAVAAAKKAAK